MDLEEWEFIPDDGFLEIHDDGGKQIYSRKYVKDSSHTVFNMNYFICPSSKSQKCEEDSRVPKQVVPLPIQFQPNIHKAPDHKLVQEIITQVPSEISNCRYSAITENIKAPVVEVNDDQESVSQIFFKKMKENEFVDMKMDSPRSSGRGILPQVESKKFQFEEKGDHPAMETRIEEEMVASRELDDHMISWEEIKNDADEGVNMWKWSLTGIGAICSFGVAAAATLCIIILGNGPKSRNQYSQHNHQMFGFQNYADDKRMKNVMGLQARRLKEAISASRGNPLARAHITSGGYYDRSSLDLSF